VTLPTALFIFRDLRARGFWLTEWTRRASDAQRVRATHNTHAPLFAFAMHPRAM
jgi:hypothetical protein